MIIKCHLSKGTITRVRFLQPNEDPVPEMTIGNEPEELSVA